jgi:hypothetical protein
MDLTDPLDWTWKSKAQKYETHLARSRQRRDIPGNVKRVLSIYITTYSLIGIELNCNQKCSFIYISSPTTKKSSNY